MEKCSILAFVFPKINFDKYDHFILMNGGIRGPFYPPILSENDRDWISLYTAHLKDDIVQIGLSITCRRNKKAFIPPHVQTMFSVYNRRGFHIAKGVIEKWNIPPGNDRVSKYSVVITDVEFEIGKRILAANLNMKSMLYLQQSIDWRNQSQWRCGGHWKYGDLQHPEGYYGINIHPLENLFMKVARRHIDDATLGRFTEWTNDDYESSEKWLSIN